MLARAEGIMRGQGLPRKRRQRGGYARRRQRGGKGFFGTAFTRAKAAARRTWRKARGYGGKALRGIGGAVVGEARNIASDALRPGSSRGQIVLNAKRRMANQFRRRPKRSRVRTRAVMKMVGGCVGCGGTCGGRGKQGCV